MPKLKTHVHVHRGEGSVVFPAGTDQSDLPEWAREKIGAHAFEDGTGGGTPPPAPVVHEGDGPPPKAGPGSTAAAWRAYAAQQDVDVPEDATKAQIIDAVEAALEARDGEGDNA